MPILFAPTPPVGKINKIVPISEGGTGGASIAEAMTNLGAIAANTINQPNGPLGLDANGKLTIDTSAVSLSAGPAISGPTSVEVGTSTNYQITNFHAPTVYSVTAITGSVVQNGETITYTAPGNSGSGGFIINGKTYNINVTQKAPQAPTISTPVNGATNIGSTVSVTSSAFTMTSGTDTHAASHWQISTSSNFATILYESLDDTVNKTSWSKGPLTVSTTYYVRVRYKGTTYGYSGWSNVVSFSTRSSFIPSSEQAKLTASDGDANDFFGYSVSISSDGNTALIGAYEEDPSGITNAGAAYIFTRSGSTWTQQAKLTASDGAASDNFGNSVSISSDGNTALVGAFYAAPSGKTQAGAAYIFTRSGSTWSQQAKLTASDGVAYDYFGYSVSISSDGTTALVGAYAADPNGKTDAGAAYIFTRSGATWTQQAKLTASDGAVADRFGWSVSISSDGTTALVGARDADPNGKTDAGAAYIFTRSGTTWTQQAKLTASDGAANDYFGISVSISSDGNTALVGARDADPSGKSNAGAAYIFTRSGTTWTQQAKLTASDGLADDRFGVSVSISSDGNTVLIGANLADLSVETEAGVAYIFTRSGTTWSQQAKLAASDGSNVDNFGYSVSISSDGNTSLVGAHGEDPNGKANAGAAYIFK